VAHIIEHAVGIYIVLLGIACLIGVVVKRLTHLPYTIALTLVGLGIALFKLGPDIASAGFSRELIFFVLLPPLLFQGALHMQLDRLARHALPIAVFATVGVIVSTLLIGGLMFWTGLLDSLIIAMLFGALICTTDPISVLAIFRQCNTQADLKYLVEGESLFNDGTGVVVFGIILSMIVEGAGFSFPGAAVSFFKVSLGGTVVGLALGGAAYLILRGLNDHLLENAICLLVCYGSFWLAEHYHLSGVIATVCSGLLLGNYGRTLAMSPRTTETVETFFESVDFLINSLLFILIGLELQAIGGEGLGRVFGAVLATFVIVLAVRAVVVYPLFFATRRRNGSYPKSWSHVLMWGGLRGSIPIALLVGLPAHPQIDPYRDKLLAIGFGVVCLSLIIQGLTMKPLIVGLGLSQAVEPAEQDPAHHQEGLT